ncbi:MULTISPECIES: rhodanese-like domain-containing protein [Pseudoramibacter]|uniref:rhodanese-like domain-containing protein n=1 Tax=Pseudoramibacter TaxID=113286 RepID=UPI0028D4044F|nr:MULTISPECIES: rhodanese-like domain-containing protein [Pseudoramibacter]
MGLLDFLKGSDINAGVAAFKQTAQAVLLDVRTPEEYRRGRIPGAVNLPLQQIASVEKKVADKETPLFVYCLSGARSGRAVARLRAMGYTQVRNIGGINGYRGSLEG